MMRLLRRSLKFLGLTLVALVLSLLLILSAPGFLAPVVQPLRMVLVDAGLALVSGGLNGRLEIGALEGSLLSEPVVRDLRIAGARNQSILRASTISLSYDPWSLLDGALQVDLLEITDLQLKLVEEPGGSLNLVEVFSPLEPTEQTDEGGGFALPVNLEQATLQGGRIDLALSALPGVETVDDLSLSLAAVLDAEALRIRIHQVTANAQPADVVLKTLKAEVVYADGRLDIDHWLLETDTSRVTVEGAVPNPEQAGSVGLELDPFEVGDVGRLLGRQDLRGEIRGGIQATGTLADLGLNGRLTTSQGQVEVEGTIDVASAKPRYRGSADVNGLDLTSVVAGDVFKSDLNAHLQFDGQGATFADTRAELEFDIAASRFGDVLIEPSRVDLAVDSQRIEVRQFDLNTSVLDAAVAGKLDFLGESRLTYRLFADLADLRELFGVEDLRGDFRLLGDASGTWPHLIAEGDLEARDLVYAGNGLEQLDVSYRATEFRDGPKVDATITAREAQIGSSSLQSADAEVTLSRSGDSHSAQFDLALSQSPELTGRAVGNFGFGGGGYELKVDEFQARVGDNIWVNSTPLALTAGADSVDLEPFRLEHADEGIELSGGFGGDTFRDVVVQVTELELGALRDAFAIPVPLGGRLNLALSLGGSLEGPILQTSFALENTGGEGLPFERADLSLDYQDARLTGQVGINQSERKALGLFLDLPIDLALAALPMEDRLQPGTLTAEIDLDEFDISKLAQALQLEPSVAGTLSGNLEANGNYAQLGVQSDVDLGDLSLQGIAQEIQGALRMTARINAAASLDALRETIRGGLPSVSITDLLLESPAVSASLPGDNGAASIALGELKVAGSGAWNDKGLTAELREARVRASLEGFPEANLSLVATLSPERLLLKRFGVETEASAIRAEGAYTLSDGGLDFKLAIPVLELREFLGENAANLPSEVTGDMVASGTVDTPKLDVSLRYANADIDAELNAALAEQPPRYGASIEIPDLDLAQFTPSLNGRVSTTLQLEGEGFEESNRVADLRLETDSENLSLLPGLKGLVEARLRGSSVDLSKIDFSSQALALEAEGAVSQTGVDTFDYKLKILDLSSFAATVGAPVGARGELNGTLSGTYQALQTRNRIDLRSWQYGDWQGGELSAQLDASEFPASPVASGKIELAGLVGPGLTESSLTFETHYAEKRAEFSLVTNSGPFENSRVAGESGFSEGVDAKVDVLRLQRGEWIWENAGPLRAALDTAGNLSIANLDLRNGSQSISVDGTLQTGGRLSVDARIQSLQLQPALGAFSEPAPPLSGAVSADLKATGTLQRPQVAGSFDTTELRWRDTDVGRLDVDVATTEKVIDASARWLYERQEVLTAGGRWNPDRPDGLDIKIRADGFDLGRLQPLSSEIIASSGRLDLDLGVTGTLQQPQAVGSLAISDGEFQLAMLGERFEDLQSEIVFSGRRVDIRRFDIGSQKGPARLNGWVEIDDLSSFRTDLTVSTEDFRAINTAAISATITSDIAIKGSDEDLDVSGKIVVPRARVRYEALPATGAASVEPWQLTVEGVYGGGKEAALAQMETPAQGARRGPPNLDFLRASLSLDIPRNTWVQGRGTAVELTGDLKIRKRLREPFVLSGTIETRRGFASVMGRRFEIESGTVAFQGTKEINPFLDILAVHQTRGYTVYVEITGESKKPKLDFYSIPELDQADIISLLLFGRTQDKLSSSEQNGLAGSVAGSVAAGVLEGSLGAGLGLDTVAIDLGDETSGGSVGVGRYIRNDLYLSYERSFRDPQKANRGGNTVGIEFDLTPRIKIKGTGSDFGETAVDIFWQVDY